MKIIIACCIFLLLLGIFLTLLARRLDRLHRTVVKSRKALEKALIARQSACLELVNVSVLHSHNLSQEFSDSQIDNMGKEEGETGTYLDMPSAVLLADAASRCVQLSHKPLVSDGLDSIELDSSYLAFSRQHFHSTSALEEANERLEAESTLSRVLRMTIDEMKVPQTPQMHRVWEQLARARTDVKMLRTFHNAYVAQIHALRKNFFVKLLLLAGHAPLPAAVDMDDATVGDPLLTAQAPTSAGE